MIQIACSRPSPRAPGGPVADTIKDVRITGADELDDDDLREGLDTYDAARNRDVFSPRQVELDEDRLRAQYFKHGFFDVAVSSAQTRTREGIIVTFQIREGRRAVIESIELSGLPASPSLKRDDIVKKMRLERGDEFEYEVYEASKQILVDEIKRAGYAHAVAEGTVAGSGERGTAFIHFAITPGPLVRYGPVTLVGVEGELREATLNRIEIEPGEIFDPDDVTGTQSSLYDLGRFSAVRIEYPEEGAPEVIPITITVVMSSRHEWRLGGGFGADPAEYQLRARAGYSILGWPTPLTNTRLELRPKISLLRDATDDEDILPGAEASASLERLDLFYPKVRGEARVGYDFDAFELYTSDGANVRLGADTPVGSSRVHAAIGWQLRQLYFRKVNQIVIDAGLEESLGFDESYRLGFYEQAIKVDGRDDIVNPTLGVYGEVRAEEGTIAAGGAFDYVKVTPEVRGYLGTWWAVLAAKVRLGTVIGDLPVTQRYFSGGASSQRGFPERRLAPTVRGEDGEEVAIGGGALLESSLEVRVPAGTVWGLQLGTTAFLDGADVTERVDDLDLGNLHWATGVGLRVGTPIGPARFDVGYRLNRYGAADIRPGDRFAFHLSLGHAF